MNRADSWDLYARVVLGIDDKQRYWDYLRDNHREVASWPEWMRGGSSASCPQDGDLDRKLRLYGAMTLLRSAIHHLARNNHVDWKGDYMDPSIEDAEWILNSAVQGILLEVQKIAERNK